MKTCNKPQTAVATGAQHFENTLRSITKVRPRYPVDTWNDLDAAQFYVPNYDPLATNALPASLILGVVARIVLGNMVDYQPLDRDASGIVTNPQTVTWDRNYAAVHHWNELQDGGFHLKMNRVVRGMAEVLVPNKTWWYGRLHSTPSKLIPSHASFCGRTSCKHPFPEWLDGCLDWERFERMVEAGLLVPWESVEWAGLGCLLNPLRFHLDTPNVCVRKPRSHVAKTYVPVFVAESMNRLHKLLPPMLLELKKWDKNFNDLLADYLERLSNERLRYWGTQMGAADVTARMAQWDDLFSSSCWCLGARDRVYWDFHANTFGLSRDTYQKLVDTQPADLFPPVKPKSDSE